MSEASLVKSLRLGPLLCCILAVLAGAALHWLSSGTLPLRHQSSRIANHPLIASPEVTVSNPAFVRDLQAYRAKAVKTPRDRGDLLQLLEQRLQEDPVACANELYSIDALGLVDEGLIDAALSVRSGGSAALRISMARDVRSPLLRDRLMTWAFETAIQSNAEAALDLLTSLPPTLKSDAEVEVGQYLGKRADPERTARIIHNANSSFVVIKNLMLTWASGDGRAAIAFLDGLANDDLRGEKISKEYLLSEMERVSDPLAVLEYENGQPVTLHKTLALTDAIGSVAAKNPAEWEELTKGLASRPTPLVQASQAAAVACMKTDPALAAGFLERIASPEVRLKAARQATHELLFLNGFHPEAARAWRNTVTDPVILHGIDQEIEFQTVGAKGHPKL